MYVSDLFNVCFIAQIVRFADDTDVLFESDYVSEFYSIARMNWKNFQSFCQSFPANKLSFNVFEVDKTGNS